MHHLPQGGIAIRVPSIYLSSLAARIRVATTSAEARKVAEYMRTPPDEDDRLLLPRQLPWHYQTTAHHITTIFQHYQPTLTLARHQPRMGLQRRILESLQSDVSADLHEHLRKRFRRWFPAAEPAAISQRVTHTLSNLHQLPPHLTPQHRWTTWRLLSNAWNTSARFQEQIGACKLCHEDKGDTIEHLATCDGLQHLTRTHLPYYSPQHSLLKTSSWPYHSRASVLPLLFACMT